jgi:hypothetical protein
VHNLLMLVLQPLPSVIPPCGWCLVLELTWVLVVVGQGLRGDSLSLEPWPLLMTGHWGAQVGVHCAAMSAV